MMQSASNYDQKEVVKAVAAQVKEEHIEASASSSGAPSPSASEEVIETIKKVNKKPKLRQQAYYLTEQEIKTIKRLSYELDIPKSDLVRKFIDEGIANIEKKEV